MLRIPQLRSHIKKRILFYLSCDIWKKKISLLNEEYHSELFYCDHNRMIRGVKNSPSNNDVGLWNYRVEGIYPMVIYQNFKNSDGSWSYEPARCNFSNNY